MSFPLLSFEHLFPSMEDDAAVAVTDPDLVAIQESPVEDEGAFATDASQALADATAEGTVVQSALESLALNIKTTRRLLKRHKGFEDDAEAAAGVQASETDPVDAVLADTNTETVKIVDDAGETVEVTPDPKDLATEVAMEAFDAKKIFGGIWAGIVGAIKKIIQGIVNFVRQLKIWAVGPFVKSQEAFYESNKAGLGELLTKNGSAKMNLLPPVKVSFDDAFGKLAVSAGTLKSVMTSLVASVDKVLNGLGSGAEKASGLTEVTKNLGDYSKAIEEFKKTTGADPKNVTANNWVAFLVYGVTEAAALKATEQEISAVFKADDFADLAPGRAKAVNELIKGTDVAQKELTKAAVTAEKAGKKAGAAGAELKTTMQELAKALSAVRSVGSFLVDASLGGYGAYLKHRGLLVAAMKKLGAKGAAPAKPAT